MTGWNVILDGKLIDTVFYDSNCDAEYVKQSLVDHDGYDPRIEVTTDVYEYHTHKYETDDGMLIELKAPKLLYKNPQDVRAAAIMHLAGEWKTLRRAKNG